MISSHVAGGSCALRKNILISGASSGLGAGMAREFAERGCNLALCARRLERLEQLKTELTAAHPTTKIAIRALDVTQYDDVFAAFRTFREELGTLDRVIVNAGIGEGVAIGKGGFARNRAIIETNFIAALAQCEAAMEIFRAQGNGHLVVISSMSAMRGLRGGLTPYPSSTATLAPLTPLIRSNMPPTPPLH